MIMIMELLLTIAIIVTVIIMTHIRNNMERGKMWLETDWSGKYTEKYFLLLNVLRKHSQKFQPKILTPYFYNNLYLHFLRKCFQNGMYSFRENCEISPTIWDTVPCFNPELLIISVKSKVLFQCYSDCWWLCGMVSICLSRKDKYHWFLHKGPVLDWPIFLLYQL